MSSIAWSHCLCSRRMSKSSLANTDSNPLTQLGRMKGSLHASADRRAPFASFWEIVEVARSSSAVGSGRIRVINSRSPCSYSILPVRTGVSSSSESSACSGRGPDRQTLRVLVFIRFCDACSFRIMRHPSHRGHQFICTCKGTLREAPVSSQCSRVRVLSRSHG